MNSCLGPLPTAMADDFHLPSPGDMVHLSQALNPPILKGIKVHPDDPFHFEFILDRGDEGLAPQDPLLKQEAGKLIKYFLASLTIPEKDLWVNLSPYEKNRIIPQSFGLTEMGRDLLAEDYMLKQITASLIYPEGSTGKKFWGRIYQEAERRYGTTNIPVNTFNKVWIVPQKAVVFENAKEGAAYVVESKLKVMLEQDYLSLQKHGVVVTSQNTNDTSTLGSEIVREIVLPELSREVNEDKNFARLRQVYNSLILATWYKKKIKDSILAQVYEDKNKVEGVNIDDPNEKEKIYQRYLQAFKKGVYNYIKEETDPLTQQIIPRKYFSGGVSFTGEGNTRMGIGNEIELINEKNVKPSLFRSLLDSIRSKVGLVTVIAGLTIGSAALAQNSTEQAPAATPTTGLAIPATNQPVNVLTGVDTSVIQKFTTAISQTNFPSSQAGEVKSVRQLAFKVLSEKYKQKYNRDMDPDQTPLSELAELAALTAFEGLNANTNGKFDLNGSEYQNSTVLWYLRNHGIEPTLESLKTLLTALDEWHKKIQENFGDRVTGFIYSLKNAKAKGSSDAFFDSFAQTVQKLGPDFPTNIIDPRAILEDLSKKNVFKEKGISFIKDENGKIIGIVNSKDETEQIKINDKKLQNLAPSRITPGQWGLILAMGLIGAESLLAEWKARKELKALEKETVNPGERPGEAVYAPAKSLAESTDRQIKVLNALRDERENGGVRSLNLKEEIRNANALIKQLQQNAEANQENIKQLLEAVNELNFVNALYDFIPEIEDATKVMKQLQEAQAYDSTLNTWLLGGAKINEDKIGALGRLLTLRDLNTKLKKAEAKVGRAFFEKYSSMLAPAREFLNEFDSLVSDVDNVRVDEWSREHGKPIVAASALPPVMVIDNAKNKAEAASLALYTYEVEVFSNDVKENVIGRVTHAQQQGYGLLGMSFSFMQGDRIDDQKSLNRYYAAHAKNLKRAAYFKEMALNKGHRYTEIYNRYLPDNLFEQAESLLKTKTTEFERSKLKGAVKDFLSLLKGTISSVVSLELFSLKNYKELPGDSAMSVLRGGNLNKAALSLILALGLFQTEGLAEQAGVVDQISEQLNSQQTAPAVINTYQQWMAPVLSEAKQTLMAYQESLRNARKNKTHAGEITPEENRLQSIIMLLNNVIANASLTQSQEMKPDISPGSLDSSSGREIYKLTEANEKLQKYGVSLPSVDRLFGIKVLGGKLGPGKNYVIYIPPSGQDPYWRTEHLIKGYVDAGNVVLGLSFDPRISAEAIADQIYRSLNQPFMRDILTNQGAFFTGFSAAGPYFNQCLLKYGDTGLFRKSAVYMVSGNWGGSSVANVDKYPLGIGRFMRNNFTGKYENMVTTMDPNGDIQLNIYDHFSQIVSSVAQYHGLLGLNDKHMPPKFNAKIKVEGKTYLGTDLLKEAFKSSPWAINALLDYYGPNSSHSSPYHLRFLNEVLQLDKMTLVPVDISSHKGNPYYETVHIGAALSAEDGVSYGVKDAEKFFHDQSRTKVKEKESKNSIQQQGDRKGGIDLTPANLNLQMTNIGGVITFHMDPVMLAQLKNAPGFMPVVIKIQPLDSLSQFLGVNSTKELSAES